MARVLVTGGAGFIGTRTAAMLIGAGHELRILDNLDPRVHGPDARFPVWLSSAVECLRADVRDREALRGALRGVDTVLHLAALTSTSQSAGQARAYSAVNVAGTARLLRAALDAGSAPRIVLGSSRAVYGEGGYRCGEHGAFRAGARRAVDLACGSYAVRCPRCGAEAAPEPCSERDALEPVSVYGASKRSQEALCRAAGERGLGVVVLRYFNVYGSGQSLQDEHTGLVPAFYRRLAAGLPIELFEDGVPRRDFVHVSDVARANLAALAVEPGPDAVFNVGRGESIPLAGLARALGDALGRSATTRRLARHRPGDVAVSLADVGRAERGLGWRARVALGDGLREFAAWARRASADQGAALAAARA